MALPAASNRTALPERIRVDARSALTHTFALEDRIRDATPADTLKGMFFQRILEIATRAGVEADYLPLTAPPAQLRYQAFFDYPVADYFRLVHAAGTKLFPRTPISEAIRKTAEHDFARFADSKVGRVMLAFGGGARSALARSASMYGAVLKGAARIASEETADGVKLAYRNYPGLVEVYPIGTIEGACKYYQVDYEIDIRVLSPRDADYVVRIPD